MSELTKLEKIAMMYVSAQFHCMAGPCLPTGAPDDEESLKLVRKLARGGLVFARVFIEEQVKLEREEKDAERREG